jgi:hypothetical protein
MELILLMTPGTLTELDNLQPSFFERKLRRQTI